MAEIKIMHCGCHEFQKKDGSAHNLYRPSIVKKGDEFYCESIEIYAINGQRFSKEEFENLPSSTFNNAEE